MSPEAIADTAANLGYDVLLMDDGTVALYEDVLPVTDEPWDEVSDRLVFIQGHLRDHGLQLVEIHTEHDSIQGCVVCL